MATRRRRSAQVCKCELVYSLDGSMGGQTILVPRVASATDRELWQGPKTGSPRITDFRLSAQPQKLETITVTIGYKNGQLLRLHVILAPARTLDPWRWPKGSQLWGRECGQTKSQVRRMHKLQKSNVYSMQKMKKLCSAYVQNVT